VVYKNKNIHLSGPIVKKKAKEIAETFNENFKVSEGWLEKFRIRHGRHPFQMEKLIMPIRSLKPNTTNYTITFFSRKSRY
jgi:hypothetical protein